MFVQDEQLFSIRQEILAEVVDEKGNAGGLALPVQGWYRQRMPLLVREEHLEPTTARCRTSQRWSGYAVGYATARCWAYKNSTVTGTVSLPAWLSVAISTQVT